MIETTFAMIKTRAITSGRYGKILPIILDNNFIIARAEQTTLLPRQIKALYGEHHGKHFYPDLEKSVSGQVILLALDGVDAVARWRKLMGPTDPKQARPGEIRFMARDEPCMADNLVHGSDSPKSARMELFTMFGAEWYDRNVGYDQGD